MAKFFEALKRSVGAAAESFGPKRYELEGKKIICPHCGHDEFVEGRAQLNTAGMSFLNLDWANRSATTLACAECGRMEWFRQEPRQIE